MGARLAQVSVQHGNISLLIPMAVNYARGRLMRFQGSYVPGSDTPVLVQSQSGYELSDMSQ
jgi:hypothetical protein